MKMVIGSMNLVKGNRILSSFYDFAYENSIMMTINALSIEAVGRWANL